MNMPFKDPLLPVLAIITEPFSVTIPYIWSQILDICYDVGYNVLYTLTADWRFWTMTRRQQGPKEDALRKAWALNPHPEAVVDPVFASSEFLDPRDLIQVRYEMVRRVRVDGESVSASAAGFGFSRPSWYAAAAALDEGGLPGLLRARPGPRRAHKLTEEIVTFIHGVLEQDPSLPAGEVAQRVEESFGIRVHPRSIQRVLVRSPKSR